MTKKWGILIKRESKSLKFRGLEIPRDYINETEVSPKDVLTGEVYSYDSKSKTLQIASERFRKPSIMESLKAKIEEQPKKSTEKVSKEVAVER